jgi:sugar transferase (PEP-CTERM/EpsH1 system associated)
MPRVLFIAPRIPFPLMQGDRMVCYHRLQSLSTKYAITLVTFYHSQEELENLKAISDFCEEIYPIYLPKWRSVINCIMCLLDRDTPFQVAYYKSQQLQTKLEELTSSQDFDLAHYFLLRVATYQIPNHIPKIIDLIDSMQLNFSSRIAIEQNIIKKLILKIELNRITSHEINIVNKFRKSILISSKDADFVSRDSQNIEIIPAAINTSIFKPSVNIRSSSVVKIIFSGRMAYEPNIYAVLWFAKNCWERIHRVSPNTKFIVAGADATTEIINLGNRNIEIAGYVESMTDTIAQADIAVVPMQSGSGMQNKILEAMACGLPVVTTTLGLGTIEAIDGQSIMVADTVEEFVTAVTSLIQDRDKRKKMGDNGRKLVKLNYSWSSASNKINSIYEDLIDR